MKRILIVGGANGIGLSLAKQLLKKTEVERIYIVDKEELAEKYREQRITHFTFDLKNDDYDFFEDFRDIDTLLITAGFGTLSLFKNVPEQYIVDSFKVNAVAPLRIIHRFMDKLTADKPFYCGVMVSISGFMSSPFFAVYGATKAALKIFIESVNVEIAKAGSNNRILNISPGSIKGTKFNNGDNNLEILSPLSNEIITHLVQQDDLFIPDYDSIYKEVLQRYHDDFRAEGMHSYDYKVNSGRIKES